MEKLSSSQMLLPFSFFIRTFVFLQLFFFTIQIQIYFITADERYTSCAPFTCGKFTAITYPFWSVTQPNYCGHPKFKLNCQNESLTLDIMSQRFIVISLNQTSRLLRIARADLYDPNTIQSCPLHYIDVQVDLDFFHFTPNDKNYTLLHECRPLPDVFPLSSEILDIRSCHIDGGFQDSYLVLKTRAIDFNVLKCKHSIVVPGLNTSLTNQTHTLKKGFELMWSGVDDEKICHECKRFGERCGYNTSSNKVMCLSPKKSASPSPQKESTWNWKKILVVAVVCAVLASLALITIICCYRHRNNASSAEPPHERSLSLSSTKFRVEHFTDAELELATNNFCDPLGVGASATVYKGLHNCRQVAVKRFDVHRHDIDLLIKTEVERLVELFHPNIVRIYGYTSFPSQTPMIVYEYIDNGALDDHLHGETHVNLDWNLRLNIAVEIASALTYIHIRNIVHRDIKSSNIFLNSNLHAKLGDFGLARLFQNDESHVAMGPQGTPGYVDPEYRQQSELTRKSDVFSFGVVLIELISALPAYDNITRNGDDVYLYNLAKRKIQNRALNEIVDQNLGFDLAEGVTTEKIRRVADLAIQCVEDSKDMRPTMQTVFENLKQIQSIGGNEGQPDQAGDEIVLLGD